MIARGLQRLDAQDHARWRLGCENPLTPAFEKNLLGSRNEYTLLEQNSDDDWWYLKYECFPYFCSHTTFLQTWVFFHDYLCHLNFFSCSERKCMNSITYSINFSMSNLQDKLLSWSCFNYTNNMCCVNNCLQLSELCCKHGLAALSHQGRNV